MGQPTFLGGFPDTLHSWQPPWSWVGAEPPQPSGTVGGSRWGSRFFGWGEDGGGSGVLRQRPLHPHPNQGGVLGEAEGSPGRDPTTLSPLAVPPWLVQPVIWVWDVLRGPTLPQHPVVVLGAASLALPSPSRPLPTATGAGETRERHFLPFPSHPHPTGARGQGG